MTISVGHQRERFNADDDDDSASIGVPTPRCRCANQKREWRASPCRGPLIITGSDLARHNCRQRTNRYSCYNANFGQLSMNITRKLSNTTMHTTKQLNCPMANDSIKSLPSNGPSRQSFKSTSSCVMHQIDDQSSSAHIESPKATQVLHQNYEKFSLESPLELHSHHQHQLHLNKTSIINQHHSTRKMANYRQASRQMMSITIFVSLSLLSLVMLSASIVVNGSERVKRWTQDNDIDDQLIHEQPNEFYYPHAGDNLHLACRVRNRLGECLWLHNGRGIGNIAHKYAFKREPLDGDCSLTIFNVSMASEDGDWQCQVTSPSLERDAKVSRLARLVVLVVPEAPSIKNTSQQQIGRLLVDEGRPKSIVCEVKGGNPAPTIEWFLNGKNVTKDATLAQMNGTSTNARITMSRLRTDIRRQLHSKNLTCVSIHPTLNQSSSVELDVHYVPTVSVAQHEYTIVEGSPLSVTCQVDANPAPTIVNWRLVSDGLSGRKRSGSLASVAPPSVTSPTRPGPVLEFDHITRDLNQQTFECLAQNEYGISSPVDVTLNVLFAPVALNSSVVESVAVGTSASLTCQFDGNPEPEIRWFFLDPLGRYSQPQPLANKFSQYTITNASYRHEGEYHCEASNRINGLDYLIRSGNIILDVFGEPQFLSRSVSSKASQGSRAELALSYCSDPAPSKIYWQFGSIRLDVRTPNFESTNGDQSNGNGFTIVNNDVTAGQTTTPNARNGLASESSLTSVAAMRRRFVAKVPTSLQRRESPFSKSTTCFEAVLTINDVDVADQRDYTLVVQNSRGHQSALVRLKVSSPMSPMLMLASTLLIILFLFTFVLIVLLVTRHRQASIESSTDASNSGQTTVQMNGATNGTANGLANRALAAAHMAPSGATKGNKLANAIASIGSSAMGGNSDEQGIAGQQAPSETNTTTTTTSSSAGTPTSTRGSPVLGGLVQNLNQATNDQERHDSMGELSLATVTGASTGATYQAAESITPTSGVLRLGSHHRYHYQQQLPQQQQQHQQIVTNQQENHQMINGQAPISSSSSQEGLIYANLEFNDSSGAASMIEAPISPVSSGLSNTAYQRGTRNNTVYNNDNNVTAMSPATPNGQQQVDNASGVSSVSTIRSVGATIAMINQKTNGATGVNRKPGVPPKPPKPMIHQRSKFFTSGAGLANSGPIVDTQQHQTQANNGLVMIAPNVNQANETMSNESSAHGIEYARISFPARAEL